MKFAAETAAGGFQDNLGPTQIRNGLQDAAEMVRCVRPVGQLASVEKLNCSRSTNASRSRGADTVTAIHLVEVQFFRVCRPGVRLQQRRAVRMKPGGHIE